MAVTLHPDLPLHLLSHLIVADIAPSKGPLSSEFQAYVGAMKQMEESKISTRKDAQDILAVHEPVCTCLCPSLASFLTLSRTL